MSDMPIKVTERYVYLQGHPKFTGCLIDEDDHIAWYKNGQWHRKDGPAVEYTNGNKVWCLNGKHHRTDGPAIELASGSKSWWINGKLHRENGPAIEYPDGSKEWYLNGTQLTEQEHRLKVRHIKLKLLDIDQHSL
jgi:hypothetical protein